MLGGVGVHILKIILEIIFVIDCIALAVVVLMQEGKSQGLGALAGGSADTYWGKNKGRSLEGALERATKVMAVLFLLLALALNLKIFS